jgi:Fe-S oxidoreductase
VATLNRYRPARIVTQCPHCYHNLKKEYRDFGGEYDVVHEGEFLAELIRDGRLPLSGHMDRRITYHDPCFMARHDRKWLGARQALRAIPGLYLSDVAQSRNRTYCCGAGGGCFWKEEVGGSRINEARLTQLVSANPDTVAVGCPFCMSMMEDAVKSRAPDNSNRVMDLAEIIAEAAGTC